MAERTTAKARKSSQSRAAKPAAKSSSRAKTVSKTAKPRAKKNAAGVNLTGAIERLEAEIVALKTERDRLKGDLAVSNTRVLELEKSQTQAINRIDWVIDSLHNVIEPSK